MRIRRPWTAVTTTLLVALVAGPALATGTVQGTVQDTSGEPVADAVVFLADVPGTFDLPKKPVVMDQRDFLFVPRVLPVVVGTTVDFLNSDAVRHNVFSPDGSGYNLGTWPTGETRSHTFAECEEFPCVYTQLCNVHPEMEGFVVVLPNPFFARTDASGRFTIAGIPPGTYTLNLWHPDELVAEERITVKDGGVTTITLTAE